MSPVLLTHLRRSANGPPLALDPRTAPAEKAPGIDVFSPPVIFGATFFVLFGVGIVDTVLFDERIRLRGYFVFFNGLSLPPLLYLVLSYGCFAMGYSMKRVAVVIRRVRPSPRRWVPGRASIVTTLSFTATFVLLVAYTRQVGYGRYVGEGGGGALGSLSLLGEMSMVPYVFSLVRDACRRSGNPGSYMSPWDRFFLWGVMLPAQLLLSILIGNRLRAVGVAVLAMAAHHYGHRRLRLRTFVLAGFTLLFVVTPVLEYLRPQQVVWTLPGESTSYAAQSWQSIAGRTSSVETFIAIFDDLESAPEPGPAYWVLTTGLVPRFLWPTKPESNFAQRLTFWATGEREFDWVGPTLPGELLMLFGYGGGPCRAISKCYRAAHRRAIIGVTEAGAFLRGRGAAAGAVLARAGAPPSVEGTSPRR